MKETELAESITKAMDFNLSQIFNEIDLKVKNIVHSKAKEIALLPSKKQETRIIVFSEFKTQTNNLKATISFSKVNAMMMVDLIKGAPFGTTKCVCAAEINSLKDVSLNLFKAYINSLNSVANTQIQLTESDAVFSFSDFENEFVVGNNLGEGRLIELSLTVGGTNIKGEMKFFAPIQLIK